MLGSPKQNGVAERRNQTLMDIVRSMRSNDNLPQFLSTKALKMAVYIINWVPTKVVQKAPFELFKCWKPSLRHILVWGCLSEVRIYNPQEKKLDVMTISGHFIGYAENSEGYRFYCPSHTTRIVKSRNSKFLENDLIHGSGQIHDTLFERDHYQGQTSGSSHRLTVIHTHVVETGIRQQVIENPQTFEPVDLVV